MSVILKNSVFYAKILYEGSSNGRSYTGCLLTVCLFVHCKKPQRGGLSGVSDDVSYNEG